MIKRTATFRLEGQSTEVTLLVRFGLLTADQKGRDVGMCFRMKTQKERAALVIWEPVVASGRILGWSALSMILVPVWPVLVSNKSSLGGSI